MSDIAPSEEAGPASEDLPIISTDVSSSALFPVSTVSDPSFDRSSLDVVACPPAVPASLSDSCKC